MDTTPLATPRRSRHFPRWLLTSGLACALACNAAAVTRLAGLTNAGSAIPPEGGLLRLGAATLAANEDSLRCVVTDPGTGYAWFGASTSPGQVIKVAFDGTNSPPRRVASLMLEPGEDSLFTAVIDTNAGFAYFGTAFTTPARVIKVALDSGAAPPSRVGAVTLDAGEVDLYCAVIDPAAGYAYFGTRTWPGRVVKVTLGAGTNPPARVGAVTLNFGENILRSAVIDPTAGFAWFGTYSDPAYVVKVALGAGSLPPSRLDALTLDPGEKLLTSAVMDRAAGQAWFGTYTAPGRVVKVALGSGGDAPTRLGSVTLNAGEDSLACAAMSAAPPGYAFFGSDAFPGMVTKVALGSGTNAPTRVGSTSLSVNEDYLTSAGDVGGALFFGTLTQPGQVIQVGNGASGQPPVRQSGLVLSVGESELQSLVIDAVNGYGWFGAATFPGQIVKVKLGKAGQPPQRLASLTLEPGEDRPICAVADVASGYAWFGTDTGPGRVVKVALGAGNAPPTRVGAVTLNSDERALRCAVLDLTNRYAYFGTAVFAGLGRVVKVALGDSNQPPARVAAVALDADEWDFESAVINGAGTHALFGTSLYNAEATGVSKVVKVALGAGASAPTRVGALTLPVGEAILNSAVSDPLTGYAWFGAAGLGYTQGQAIKISFEAAGAAPQRVGAAALSTNATPLNGAAVDPAAGYAVFGGNRHLVKVALGAGEAAPAKVGEIEFPSAEDGLHCGAGDPSSGLAWFGTSTQPGNVVLASYSQKGFIKGTRFVLTESGALTDVNFYSHRAAGQLRLALYARDGTNRDRLWQSGVISNTVANGWISVPVSQGTPTTLQLTPGTNDLCWQVDTTGDVPGYLAGDAGDGFRQPADFGPFPAVLTEGANNFEPTGETWASFIAYDVPLPVFTDIRRSNDTVTLTWLSNPGTLYQVQTCTNLPPPAWTNVALVQATGTTTTWNQSGLGATTARFYRLKLLP